MRFRIFATALCLVFWNYATADRGSRKLFGGYRITPRLCKPTRTPPSSPSGGPNVCMFNHECLRRGGQVVGACMDGFLFGACCELPAGTSVGDLQDEEHRHELLEDGSVGTTPFVDITSNGVSKITASLVGVLPTADGDDVVQMGGAAAFPTPGLAHHQTPPETILQHQDGNEIDPGYFKPTNRPVVEDRKTTTRIQESYSNTPIYGISLSNAPLEYTTVSGFNRPMFRPRPPSSQDKYVLVPTITHDTKSNKTQQFQSVVNIVQMLNSSGTESSNAITTSKPPSTSYVYSTKVSRRPTTTSKRPTTSTPKPPSTSYVYSSTVPPRRTQTTKKPPHKPPRRPTVTTKKPTSYIYSLSPTKTTLAYSPDAFLTPSNPTRRPNVPSAAPTVIVLGAIPEDPVTTPYPQRRPSPINQVTINNHITQNIYSTTERPSPTVLITPKPSISSSQRPQDDYDTIEVQSADISSSTTTVDDDNNFPPVRNPNLNVSSLTGVNENDVTTPVFAEDEALNKQVESFVNQIIQGLQEPFQGLKEVVYNRRNSTLLPVGTTTTSTRRPATTRPNVRPSLTRPTATTTTTTTTRRPTAPNRRTTTTAKPKSTKRPVTTTQSFIEHDTEGTSPLSDSEDYRTQCGVRPLMKTGRIVGGKGATFGEFPWQVLVRESTWLGLFTKNKCGGVLISRRYVMTAAHCQPGFLASLVAVFGEFDISGDLEKKRPISRNVKRVIVHRQYDPTTFENDLALLELEQPVHFDAHILPICLPRDDDDFTGRLATVTGWGRLKYGGGVPSVLQEVQVPIMENPVCQEMFRTAGHTKVILDSFLCAGYANGQKDSCEGDSGGPLVLQRPDGRYQLAGTVSHGIKCAAPYLPGVYMRTQFFKPWITSITGVTSP